MKTLFIINKARRDRDPADALIDQMRQRIKDAGLDCDIQFSESIDECNALITKGLDDHIEALWIGGGDGTINHVLNRTMGKDIVYGIVPMGTVNALAQAIGIPIDPLEAIDYLLQAKPVRTDVGELYKNGRKSYFFTYATVGIHAAVFHNIDTRLKKRFGRLAFWESGLRTLWQKSRLPRFLLTMQTLTEGHDQPAEIRDYGYSFTLSNVANYAGYGAFTNNKPALPGAFELHTFRRNKVMPMLTWYAIQRLFGIDRAQPKSGVHIRRINKVHVRSHRHLSVQIDGEPLRPKSKELTFTCLPNAVKLLLQHHDARNLKEETRSEKTAVTA